MWAWRQDSEVNGFSGFSSDKINSNIPGLDNLLDGGSKLTGTSNSHRCRLFYKTNDWYASFIKELLAFNQKRYIHSVDRQGSEIEVFLGCLTGATLKV